ncbi:MAG: hypothetical protein KAS72_00240 [Phycisphaerales bacterium]|nr:hypothetical protein [Phycisphaerales bacterium]
MRVADREIKVREIDEAVAARVEQWADLPLTVPTAASDKLRLVERWSSAWPEENALAAHRAQRVEQVRSIHDHLLAATSMPTGELAELVNELIGLCLDSPWRVAHLALVHTYHWAGSESSDAGDGAPALCLDEWSQIIAQRAYSAAVIATLMAAREGWPTRFIRAAGLTALLQNVGMLILPKSLWQIDRALDDVELNRLQRYPAFSVYLIETLQGLDDAVRLAVYQHRERSDSSGYPRRLRNTSICDVAKLTAVAETYAWAIEPTCGHPPPLPHDVAVDLLGQVRDGQLDQSFVRLLIRSVGLFPTGSLVRMSTGGSAVVIANPPDPLDRPVIRYLAQQAGITNEPIALSDKSASQLQVRSALPRWSSQQIPSALTAPAAA